MRALHLRLTLWFAVLLTTLAVGLLLLLSRTTGRYADEELQRLNAGIAMYVVRELPLLEGKTINNVALAELGRRAMTVNPSTEVYLLNPQGHLLTSLVPISRVRRRQVDLRPIQSFLQFPDQRPVYGDDPASTNARRVFSVWPIESHGRVEGYLYVVLGGQPAQSIAARISGSYVLRTATITLLMILGAALLVAGGLFAVLTRRLRTLAARMDAWANALPASALARSSAHEQEDEISALSARFDAMSHAIERHLGELKATDELRRELIANVSHDLRTPLASLRGYIETVILKGTALAPGDLYAHLRVALRQTDQLERLVDALFELAKLESGAITPKFEPFVVAELLQDVVLRFRMQSEERGVGLHALPTMDNTMALGDLELIERVLGNLLENAVRYTPVGGHVRTEMTVEPTLVRVRVIDTGSGIEPQTLPRIFDRFYSAPDHSDRDRAGLGLAIVKRIIDLHGQSVRVLSEKGSGTTVEFTLSKAGDIKSHVPAIARNA